MVEELVCGLLQCFGEHIWKGFEFVAQLFMSINPSLSNKRDNREVDNS